MLRRSFRHQVLGFVWPRTVPKLWPRAVATTSLLLPTARTHTIRRLDHCARGSSGLGGRFFSLAPEGDDEPPKPPRVCPSCGAPGQAIDSSRPGYFPPSKLLAAENQSLTCQRCYQLAHYGRFAPSPLSAEEVVDQLSKILLPVDALVVKVVDVTDFEGSFVPDLSNVIGNHEVVLVANKFDLLPRAAMPERVTKWMRRQAKRHRLENVVWATSLSSKLEFGLDEAVRKIEIKRQKRDIYVVGVENVGKTSFINAYIKQFGSKQLEMKYTTSPFPGTTMGLVSVKLTDSRLLFDTPGMKTKSRISGLLPPAEVPSLAIDSRLRGTNIHLKEGRAVLLGGLASIEHMGGASMHAVWYGPKGLTLHATRQDKAQPYYERHVGTDLVPPAAHSVEQVPRPSVETVLDVTCDRDPKKEASVDVVLPGLGWMTLFGKGSATLRCRVPSSDIRVTTREPLLPFHEKSKRTVQRFRPRGRKG